MIEYLDLEDLLEIVRAAVGGDAAIRDYGLLETALARPRASVFGADAYPEQSLLQREDTVPALVHAGIPDD
jgi:death on curing protein